MNIEELNTKMKEQEELILNRKEIEIKMRKTKELLILQLTTEYEQKYKEFKETALSNMEKRTAEAEKSLEVKKVITELDLYKHETAILEIELNYNLRLFEIWRSRNG